MKDGYVLDFSDRTFGDFFDELKVGIDDERYRTRGTSKANRMRSFWDQDPNHVVGRVISRLIDYGIEGECFGDSSPILIEDCRKIAQRLVSNQTVAEIDALAATTDERDFDVVAGQVCDAIVRLT